MLARVMMDVLQRYYKLNRILMSCIGQWPYQTRLASRSFLGLLLFLCTSQIAPQVTAMVIYRENPVIILECVSPCIFDFLCFVKLMTCIIKSKNMLKMMNRISEDWQTWAGDREIAVLHDYADTGRKMVFGYTVIFYSTGIIFTTQPILPKIIDVLLYNGTEPGQFPVPVFYYRLDEQKYYFYIIAYTYLTISMIIIISIAGDAMFIIYVQHCCGIFAALGQKLERIGDNVKLREGKNTDFKYLATCIERHNDAIEFANLIEATYSASFFFVVGCNMIIMSVTALQILMNSNEPQATIRFIVFVIAQMIHLYIESYISQILMDHSTSIRDYIHNGEWYKISLKSQKLLNLMMMRCNVPCKVTAGKICVMSVETFGAVVKASMSYFTLMRSMQ